MEASLQFGGAHADGDWAAVSADGKVHAVQRAEECPHLILGQGLPCANGTVASLCCKCVLDDILGGLPCAPFGNVIRDISDELPNIEVCEGGRYGLHGKSVSTEGFNLEAEAYERVEMRNERLGPGSGQLHNQGC